MRKATLNRVESLDYYGTESVNTICSNLSFVGTQIRKIVMTSCNAGEGKTSTSMRIMQNFARRGKRVVLVDTDLRRSFLVKRYGFRTEGEIQGLAHYLAGFCDIDSIIYQTNIPGAYIIPVGRETANPIPLIESPQFSRLLDTLAENFDLVIVDAPPVGLVIDAAEIAKYCDGAVFVVEYNSTRRRMLLNAQRQLRQSGCPILGCIINKVAFDTFSAKQYYNKSYYNAYYGGDAYQKSGSSGKKKKK